MRALRRGLVPKRIRSIAVFGVSGDRGPSRRDRVHGRPVGVSLQGEVSGGQVLRRRGGFVQKLRTRFLPAVGGQFQMSAVRSGQDHQDNGSGVPRGTGVLKNIPSLKRVVSPPRAVYYIFQIFPKSLGVPFENISKIRPSPSTIDKQKTVRAAVHPRLLWNDTQTSSVNAADLDTTYPRTDATSPHNPKRNSTGGRLFLIVHVVFTGMQGRVCGRHALGRRRRMRTVP